MKRYERNGRWVEVGKTRSVFFNNRPCYEIDGRGDVDFYLGDAAELLYVEERPDGWTIGYAPNDDNFAEYAAGHLALDAWR